MKKMDRKNLSANLPISVVTVVRLMNSFLDWIKIKNLFVQRFLDKYLICTGIDEGKSDPRMITY